MEKYMIGSVLYPIVMAESNHALATLVRSPVRVQLLVRLERSPASVSELVAISDATRRTVLRNLNQLESGGWIRQVDDQYRLVSPADALIEELPGYLDRAERVENLLSLLAYDGADLIDVPSEVLVECELTLRRPSAPTAPLDATIARITSADTVRTFVPTVTPRLVDAHRSGGETEEGSEIKLVTGPDGIEGLRSTIDTELSPSFLRSLYGYDRPTGSIGVVLADDHTIVLVYDDHGTLHGTLTEACPSLRTWGETFYERHRSAARSIETMDVRPFQC